MAEGKGNDIGIIDSLYDVHSCEYNQFNFLW